MSGGVRWALAAVAIAVPSGLVSSWLSAAERRLHAAAETEDKPAVAVASVTEDAYCTAELKGIVRRVASACGLAGAGGESGARSGAAGAAASATRGCQPATAQQVASLSGDDFNKLFLPLSRRAAIIEFDADTSLLDEAGQAKVEGAWADQRGASFFFVVARASPDGKTEDNERLSRERAEAVLGHLERRFADPDIRKQVGLLWLGEEFAQLGDEFCMWSRSRAGECTAKDINRSAFVAWIDCAI